MAFAPAAIIPLLPSIMAAAPAVMTAAGGAAAILAPYATGIAAGAATAAVAGGAFLTNEFVVSSLASAGVEKGYHLAKKGIIKGYGSRYKPLRAISRKSVGVYRKVNTPFTKSALGYIGAGVLKTMGKKF